MRGLEAAVGALEVRLLPPLQRAADEPHLAAIRAAIQPTFYVLIAGTVIAFFMLPREDVFAQFLDAYHVGFGAMGVALTILLANHLALRFGYNQAAAILLSFAAFGISLPRPIPHDPLVLLGNLSASSLFLALIVSLATGEFLRWSHRLIRNRSLAIAAAAIAASIFFGGIAAALSPSHLSIADVALGIIKPLVGVGDTLPALLLVVFLQVLLWSAGVHGPAFLAAITTPVFLAAIDQNGQAIIHHQQPEHIVTITLFVFIFLGGSGATISLNLMMLGSKIPRLRKLGMASLLPSFLNINEPLIFGIPLVMNPSLTIPFVVVPLLLASVTYGAMWFGLVNKTTVFLPGALPAPIAAWLTTSTGHGDWRAVLLHGDWRAVVLVFVNFAITFVCYLPFYRTFEEAVRQAPATEEQLVKTAEAIREHELEVERHPERQPHEIPPDEPLR
ncbi:MAG TPA: PTS transporter subunit EIIC [Candidatus Tumulicola sp.]|nr:PTS transporter subunit EIIC [Candidatus Tumulicola sp.]